LFRDRTAEHDTDDRNDLLGLQHEEAIISPGEEKMYSMTPEEASQKSSAALQAALSSSVKITLDHWIPYFTHYELARLCSQRSDQEQAKHHLGLILSGPSSDGPNLFRFQNMLTSNLRNALQASLWKRPLRVRTTANTVSRTL